MRSRIGLLVTAAIGVVAVGGSSAAEPVRQPAVRSEPPIASASSPVAHLLAARSDTMAGRFRQAANALGQAETRLLNDAALSPSVTPPYLRRALDDVMAARAAAARSQRRPAVLAINDALLALEVLPVPERVVEVPSGLPIPLQPDPNLPLSVGTPAPSPPAPALLYRALPGHWTLRGADSVWVEPETVPVPVSVQSIVPPRQVWNGDRWVYVPEHFSGTEAPR